MESNTPEVSTETQAATVDLKNDIAGKITSATTKPSPADGQVQEYLNIGSKFLSNVFDYINY